MKDDMTWTPPRSPTFSERLRMTYALCSMGWPLLGVSLPVLWSSGATVSFLRTDQPRASLRIESGNGRTLVEVTIRGEMVTAL